VFCPKRLELQCHPIKDLLTILRITEAVAPRRRIMEKHVAKSQAEEQKPETMRRLIGFLIVNYFNLGFVNA
jgi:hypothetical protein